MADGALTWVILALACLPLFYYMFAIDTAGRFFAPSIPDDDLSFTPPLSVLKPVRGLDPRAAEHFASFCRQDYPNYEILFGVADPGDPALPIIRRLAEDYPHRSIRIVVGGPVLGPSSKVSKLCQLVHQAQHEFLIISDSDVTVPPDYLRRVVVPFRDATVGAVTCLYRGVWNTGLWSNLEALGMSTDFMPAVLVSRRSEGLKFMLGATMATTRAHLAEIGGFEALVEYCADDFELGRRIADRGYSIEVARSIVCTESVSTASAYLKHQIRWAVTVRHCRPKGYAGRVLVAQGLPWALAAAVVAPGAVLAGAYLALYLVLRLSLAWAVGVRGLRDETVRRRWWLIPVYDALAFVISVWAFCTNRIEWRGRRFELQRGRLVPLDRPNPAQDPR